MNRVLKTVRAVQWSMLVSIVLYAVLGEKVGPNGRAVNPQVSYLLATASVALVGMIFIVRRTLVLRAAENLATTPEDILSLNHWRTGYIATYVLCEALALFGLVLRFLGGSLQQSLLFYGGGFVLMFFFAPKQPARISST